VLIRGPNSRSTMSPSLVSISPRCELPGSDQCTRRGDRGDCRDRGDECPFPEGQSPGLAGLCPAAPTSVAPCAGERSTRRGCMWFFMSDPCVESAALAPLDPGETPSPAYPVEDCNADRSTCSAGLPVSAALLSERDLGVDGLEEPDGCTTITDARA